MKGIFRTLVFCCCYLGVLVACEDDGPVIAAEELSLEPAVLFLQEGSVSQLTVVVSPDNADRRFLWTSDNANVVEVDADGVVRGLRPGRAMVTATAKEGGKSASCKVFVTSVSGEHARRTVLAYIVADNNLRSFAQEDINEMKAGMLSIVAEDIHLLAYIDMGGTTARLVEISRQADGTVSEKTVVEYPGRNSVGVSETLEVFEDVFSNPAYQADSYGLIYWSHCDGWIPYPVPATRWIGQDGSNSMNLSDFVSVLEMAPHFDFIMFDACFMQSVEVAYELRRFADYYIASPTEIPGPGAPYDRIMPYLFVEGAAADVAEEYYETYAELYKDGAGISNDNWTGGTSICALSLSCMEELAGQTCAALEGMGEVYDTSRLSVFDYDQRRNSSHIGYYDLLELMQQLMDTDTFAHWKQVYDAVVVYWNTTPRNYSQFSGMFSMDRANGVTHYLPSSLAGGRIEAYRELEWYTAAGLSELGW